MRRATIQKFVVKLGAREPQGDYQAAITSPGDVVEVASALLADEAQEVVIAVSLDIRNRVLGYTEVGRGAVDSCQVDLRQVFRAAIMVGASAVVLAHNHPSGDPTPSGEDKQLTARIKQAGELLGIPLLDHVVIGAGVHASMKALALL
jgi:DNA repair protein RadC